MSAIVNAPNMDLALCSMLIFKALEDKVNLMMSSNQISAREKKRADQAVAEAKVEAWKIVLLIWHVQCSFLGARNPKSDYHVRALCLSQALSLD